MELRGATVAVTGGGRGIGKAIARAAAREGAQVAVGDLDADLALQTARELGPPAVGLALDVTDRASFATFLGSVTDALGPLDVLVNNAGIMHVGPFLEEDDPVTRTQVEVNLHGVLLGMKLALPGMVSRGRGHVVNIASMAGKTASTIYHPVYNVSKAAVLALTKTFALAHAADGIRVNAICPGIVETPMQVAIDREFARVTGKDPADIRAERVGRIPIGRVEQPEEVAAVVSFLVGPDSRYMTGQALNVTGGMITY